MPLYWAAQAATRTVNSPQAQAVINELSNWAMATGATMLVLAGACWFFCEDEPKAGEHGDINLPWEGTDPGLCCEHPFGLCGINWECSADPT
jgi:hypothetical protein